MDTNDAIARLLENQNRLLGALLKERGVDLASLSGLHTKAPASINTATLLFGTGGIFSTPGLEPDVITAYVRPKGISPRLPLLPSVNEQPRFASLTGYTATSGSEAVYPCDDNPAGYVNGCNLTARFGRLARDTQTIEFDKVMLQARGGLTTDLTLRGRVLGLTDFNPSAASESDILNVGTASEMVTAGVNMERTLSRQMWQGVTTNDTAGDGYKEFPGLDVQIATGQVDADTGIACPALDSDVKDFNYNLVGGTGLDIVEYVSMLEFYLRYNAMQMGLDPVEWIVVMRPELWQELTAAWPIKYNTNRATAVPNNATLFIDGRDNVTDRDRMRRAMTIDINGNNYPVIVDTGIAEATNITNANVPAGSYASSIYMLPLSIIGNFPVLYREHVDYRQGARDLALMRNLPSLWTDAGQYSWVLEQNKWCLKLSVKTEQRVVLRTPQLAGRIDNVLYSPLQHLREPDPSSPYHYDGGVSMRAASTVNAVWLS